MTALVRARIALVAGGAAATAAAYLQWSYVGACVAVAALCFAWAVGEIYDAATGGQ